MKLNVYMEKAQIIIVCQYDPHRVATAEYIIVLTHAHWPSSDRDQRPVTGAWSNLHCSGHVTTAPAWSQQILVT